MRRLRGQPERLILLRDAYLRIITMTKSLLEKCPGCGGLFAPREGPTHRYMTSSPACWDAFGRVLAREYSTPALMPTHRLSVDAFAVQHPGDGSPLAIKSTGLHLARLMIQLERPLSPVEVNEVILELGKAKQSLIFLTPPKHFAVTVADVVNATDTDAHSARVMAWARDAWSAWSNHHAYVRDWVRRTSIRYFSEAPP